MDPKRNTQPSELFTMPLCLLLTYILLIAADNHLPDASPLHPFLEHAYLPVALSFLLYGLLRLSSPQPAVPQNRHTALLAAVHRTMPASADWHWEEVPALPTLPGEESFLELRNTGDTFLSAFLVEYHSADYGTNVVVLPQGVAPGHSCFLRAPVLPEQLETVQVACLVDDTSASFRFSGLRMPEHGAGFFGCCTADQDFPFLDVENLHCRICPNR